MGCLLKPALHASWRAVAANQEFLYLWRMEPGGRAMPLFPPAQIVQALGAPSTLENCMACLVFVCTLFFLALQCPTLGMGSACSVCNSLLLP